MLFLPMLDHAATEAALQDSGVAFTSLRNGFYATTTVQLLRGALQTGELAAPEDGPVSWTSHADLAEAAAIALTGHDLDGLTPASRPRRRSTWPRGRDRLGADRPRRSGGSL